MGKGLDRRRINIGGDILAQGFLGEDNRNMKILRSDAGNSYAGCLDRKDLVHSAVLKKSVKFLADLINQLYVYLVVKKTVNFQNIARKYLSVFKNSFFKKLHFKALQNKISSRK